MTDADHIGIGGVVFFDHLKVGKDQKGRALRARWQQDRGRARIRQRAAFCRANAQRLPVGDRLFHPLSGFAIVEPGGQRHFDAPGPARLPACIGKIGGGRGQRIGGIIRPDIAPPVAGEIHRMGKVRGGNELGVAHGPGPASGHRVGPDIAALHDGQRRQKLPLKEGPAPGVIGQSGKRADQRIIPAIAAIGAFQAPDRHHHFLVHAIGRLDPIEQRQIVAQRGLAVFNPRVRDGAVQIVPDRLGEFALIAVFFHHGGIEAGIPEGGIEGLGRDARRKGAGAKARHPGGKARLGSDIHTVFSLCGRHSGFGAGRRGRKARADYPQQCQKPQPAPHRPPVLRFGRRIARKQQRRKPRVCSTTPRYLRRRTILRASFASRAATLPGLRGA